MIKNLNVKKVLKNTAIAFVTGTMLTSAPVSALNDLTQTNAVYSNYSAMDYFTNSVASNVEKYLDKEISSGNLTKVLNYYETLYNFINKGTVVRSTYFYNLSYAEQDELKYLLNSWGNRIYESYKSKLYFSTTCQSVLGFTLKYNSQETGYDYEHKITMDHYTEDLNAKIEEYLYSSNSMTNLNKSLEIYKQLVSFIKGSTRSYGYVFSELTLTEQAEIAHLIQNWTYNIMEKYAGYSYYSNTCVSKVGWTVNIENLNRELGSYTTIYNNPTGNYNQNAIIQYFNNMNSTLNSYVTNKSETNLNSALDIYSNLWNFIKGSSTVYGYYFNNLNNLERETLINALGSWTHSISNAYSSYNTYTTNCISKVGWIVSAINYNQQLINLNINNSQPIIPPVIDSYNPVVPPVIDSYKPVTPPAVDPIKPTVNNTIGKDWHSNYVDPSVNYFQREVEDYTPEYAEGNNFAYPQDNNYYEYNNYGYNNYQDQYVKDYVPTYIPR